LTTPNLFPTNQPIQEDNGTSVPPSGLSAMWPYFPENVPYNFVIVVQPYSATMHSSYLNGIVDYYAGVVKWKRVG